MRVKTTMRQMKDAKVAFISLVARGANRIPFRVIKSQGEEQMLDLTQMAHVLKNEVPQKQKSTGFAAILNNGKPAQQPAKPALQSVAKSHQAPTQVVAKAVPPTPAPVRQSIAEASAPAASIRRGANTPKQPTAAPSHTRGPKKSMEQTIAEAMAAFQAQQRRQTDMEAFNEKRSAFSQIAPTPRTGRAAKAQWSNADALRNFGGRLAVAVMGSPAFKGEGAQRVPAGSMCAVSGDSLRKG